MKLSEVKPEFALPQFSTQKLWRIDGGNDRYYFLRNAAGQVTQTYISVTSAASYLAGDKKEVLISWISKHGMEAANFLRDSAADKGTIMHKVCAMIARNEQNETGKPFFKTYQDVEDYVFAETQALGYNMYLSEWPEFVQRAVYAFLTFWREKECKLLACEIAVRDDAAGVAGCIDYVVELTHNRKRHIALIDLKSGSSFWREHEFQLAAYRHIWNKMFPGYPATLSFNWRPKDWTGGLNPPKIPYELKNQTGNAFENQTADGRTVIEALLSVVRPLGYVNPRISFSELTGDLSSENPVKIIEI